MKKIMSLAVAALMLQGAASANLFCGNFWVAGEALLLRPSGAYPYDVLLGPSSAGVIFPEGTQLASCPSYEWGYKIELGYRNCDKEILINWQSFDNSYKNKLAFTDQQAIWETSASPGAQQDGPGTYRHAETYRYKVIDAEVAKWFCEDCSCFMGRLFFGLRYARIQHNRAAVTTIVFGGEDLDTITASRSDVQGTGPRVGLGGRWDVWCDFGLTGSVAGHLLFDSAKSQFFNEVILASSVVVETMLADVKNRSTCRILPATEVRFGIDWRPCLFCGFGGLFEVGYQITHYFYGDQSTLFTQNDIMRKATNHVHTDPISFDGWYFRIGLQY